MTEREQWGTSQYAPSPKQLPQGARSEHEHKNRWAVLDSNQPAPSGEERDSDDVGDGRQAPVPGETVTLLPELSLEDRLLVALSRRGSRTIDEFMFRAREQMTMDLRPWRWASDDSLVEACERYATELGQ